MAEEAKERWMNYLALTTIVLAVCATLSTFKGGGFSTRSVINQAKASDEWAYFQAKSIRESLHQQQQDKLQLEYDTLPGNVAPEVKARYQKALVAEGNGVQKYAAEKVEIQRQAKQFEAMRDEAQRHGQAFGLAVIFLQVAILISSIAGLLKRKAIWLLALPIGLLGIVYFVDGFLLFM